MRLLLSNTPGTLQGYGELESKLCVCRTQSVGNLRSILVRSARRSFAPSVGRSVGRSVCRSVGRTQAVGNLRVMFPDGVVRSSS